MRRAGTTDLINGFLGSTQVFATAVRNVVEEKLLREIAPPTTDSLSVQTAQTRGDD
jgi:hypothetical protein